MELLSKIGSFFSFPTEASGRLEPSDMRVPVVQIALYFFFSRLLILMVAWLSLLIVVKGSFYSPKTSVLDWFLCWDALRFFDIANNGYSYHPGEQSSVAFFPLYPLLLNVSRLGFLDVRVAGYLLSNLFLFVACVFLWKLVRRDYGSKAAADRTVLLLLICPVSFFFSIPYSESLFICLSVMVFYFAEGKRWIVAGVCGYFAALTKHVGVLLTVPILIEVICACRRQSLLENGPAKWVLPENPLSALTSLALPVLGLATYCLFLQIKFGNPLVFMEATSHWGRHFGFSWHSLAGGQPPFYKAWFIGSLYTALALICLSAFVRLRLSQLIFSPMCLVVFLLSNSLEATPRVISVMFPLYVAPALLLIRWPRMEPLVVAFSVSLLTLSVILFVNGYWFT